MYDHKCLYACGMKIPVSRMPTKDIIDCLQSDIEIYPEHDVGNITKDDVIERLRIELLIRELSL